MINAIELTLLAQFQSFWNTLVTNIGTINDVIPQIFSNLPADGDEGTNQKAIGEAFTRMNTGNPNDDVTFLLQFPATKGQVPAITIEVGTETEEEVIGSFVSQDFNQLTQQAEVSFGGPFTKTYQIGIYSFQPDITLYLYCFVKYALLVLRGSIDGISNIAISTQPMKVDFQRFGDAVYFRYIDLRIEGVLDTAVESFEIVRNVTVSNSIINSVDPDAI